MIPATCLDSYGWRKSDYSGNGGANWVEFRETRDHGEPVLRFGPPPSAGSPSGRRPGSDSIPATRRGRLGPPPECPRQGGRDRLEVTPVQRVRNRAERDDCAAGRDHCHARGHQLPLAGTVRYTAIPAVALTASAASPARVAWPTPAPRPGCGVCG